MLIHEQILIWIIDKELAFIRWLLFYKFLTGKDILPTILQLRETRERLVNVSG